MKTNVIKSILTIFAIGLTTYIFAEDLIIDGETIYLAGEHHYDNVIIINGGVLAMVEFGGSNDIQGKILLYSDSIYIDSTSSINGNGAGGDYGNGSGGDVGNWGSGDGYYSGGGGGGFGGNGGIGGGDYPGSGGNTYGTHNYLNRGSRGGWGINTTGNSYQIRGAGGGVLYIEARITEIHGSITVNGNDGILTGSGGGPGGGSSGMVWLNVENLLLTGNILAKGGKGANPYSTDTQYAGGGGGGGGRITIITKSIIDTNLCFVDGGQGGDNGNGYPGLSGEDGIIYYMKIWLTSDTHTDENKFSVNPLSAMNMTAVGDIYGYFYEINQNPDGIADNTSNFTQSNIVELDSLADGEWYFHAVPMDSSFNILVEQHMTYHLRINANPLEISSPTHQNQNYFYDNSNPVFNIESMDGIDEYFYIIDQNTQTAVDELTGTYLPNSQLILPGLSDGTYYLHIVGYDDFGFVGINTSHFQVNIGPPQPIVSFSSDLLEFELTTIGQNSIKNLTMLNLGNGDLEVYGLSLSDTNNFSIIPSSVVEPVVSGDSVIFEIVFHPQDTLNHNDTLIIESNDPINASYNIYLNGKGSVEPTEYIYLEIPIIEVILKDTFLIPLNVQFPPSTSFSSAEIKISGYIGLLDFVGITTDSSLLGDAGWTYQVNETDSLLITAFAGADDISGEGVLLWLQFYVPETASDFIPITLDWGKFNTGEIPTSLTSGGVNVLLPEYGDVDLNGLVEAYDASLILKYLVEYIELDNYQLLNADVSLDNTVSSLDASLILQYVVNLIDTLPYDSASGVFFAYGEIDMEDAQIEPGQIIEVPLHLSNGDNILSFESVITFNTDHLIFNEILWSELLGDFTIETNIVSGEIMLAGAGTLPDGQEGIFTTVLFTVDESFDENETTVNLERLRWNEEEIMENVASATLTKVLATGDENMGIPTEFGLSQNYPNPFNPVTTISYQLPKSSFVNLTIYNITGQMVETMVSEYKNVGYHSVIWNASGVGSGLYFYRIEAGEYSETKKCLILK